MLKEQLKLKIMKTRIKPRIYSLLGFLLFANVALGQALDAPTKIARTFSEKYCKNYICKATQYKTIQQNGKYVQFDGIQMIFGSFDFSQTDRTSPYFSNNAFSFYYAPISVMRSDAFENGKRINYYSNRSSDNDNLYNSYSAIPGEINSFSFERAIEIQGPLNPEMIQFYNFSKLTNNVNSNGDKIIEISFNTIPQKFPSNVRLLMSGKMFYNDTKNYLEKIVVDDFVSFYTTAIYRKSYSGNNATPTKIEIQYTFKNNQIFTSSITYSTKWVDPNNENFYEIKSNARTNPFKTKLVEREVISCSDFVVLNNTKEAKDLLQSTVMATQFHYYYAPFDSQMWSGVIIDDFPKIKSDLNVLVNFDTQVKRNGMTIYDQDINTKQPFFIRIGKNMNEYQLSINTYNTKVKSNVSKKWFK